MMRTTSDLPRSVRKWVSQVSVSVGATLVATMIYGALPKAVAPPAPSPEMTSGGKFAARVDRASSDAYDGLDTMPLPHVAAPAAPAAFLLAPVPAQIGGSTDADQPAPSGQAALTGRVHQAGWDGAVVPSQDRAVRLLRTARSAARSDVRLPVAGTEAITAPGPDLLQADDGLLSRAISTARNAWAFTTSASSALVSRLIP